MAIDALKVAKRLREAGFSEAQAEAVVTAVQETTAAGDLAAKVDLDAARTELKAEIAQFRAEVKAEIADLRNELRQSGLRLEAKLESIKADILSRVFGLILSALVVNIVAIVGAVVVAAKLIGD
jgi:DNA-binding transcriptional MerR regulator